MADFTVQALPQIPDSERHFIGEANLTEGQSGAGKIAAIVNGNPQAGSNAELLKNILTKTIPAGRTAKIKLAITIVLD